AGGIRAARGQVEQEAPPVVHRAEGAELVEVGEVVEQERSGQTGPVGPCQQRRGRTGRCADVVRLPEAIRHVLIMDRRRAARGGPSSAPESRMLSCGTRTAGSGSGCRWPCRPSPPNRRG